MIATIILLAQLGATTGTGFLPLQSTPNNRLPMCMARECAHWNRMHYVTDLRANADGSIFIDYQELLKRLRNPRLKEEFTWLEIGVNILQPLGLYLSRDLSQSPIRNRVQDITDPRAPIECINETKDGFWSKAIPGHLIRVDTMIDLQKTPEQEAKERGTP